MNKRQEELLNKYRNGTIGQEEAGELQEYLDERKEELEEKGDYAGAFAVGVLSLAVGAFRIYLRHSAGGRADTAKVGCSRKKEVGR